MWRLFTNTLICICNAEIYELQHISLFFSYETRDFVKRRVHDYDDYDGHDAYYDDSNDDDEDLAFDTLAIRLKIPASPAVINIRICIRCWPLKRKGKTSWFVPHLKANGGIGGETDREIYKLNETYEVSDAVERWTDVSSGHQAKRKRQRPSRQKQRRQQQPEARSSRRCKCVLGSSTPCSQDTLTHLSPEMASPVSKVSLAGLTVEKETGDVDPTGRVSANFRRLRRLKALLETVQKHSRTFSANWNSCLHSVCILLIPTA